MNWLLVSVLTLAAAMIGIWYVLILIVIGPINPSSERKDRS